MATALAPHDLSLIWQHIADLTEATGTDEFAPRLLGLLALLSPYDSALVVYYGRRRRPVILADRLLNAKRTTGTQEYLAGAYLLDPFYQKSRDISQSCILRLRDIVADDFEDSDYFTKYYHGTDVVDEINLFVPLEPGRVFAVCLERAMPSASFGDVEIARLQQALPAVDALARRHVSASGLIGAPDEADNEHDRFEHVLQSFGDAILTPREREVVRLMLSGHSAPEVAQRLGVSLDTAKVHRRNIYGKLGVSSLAGLFSMVLHTILQPENPQRLAGQDAM